MSFVIPIHAVDLELEKPDRFYVQDVWEVADEPTEDVVAGLEELEEKLLESPTAWANICTNAVFDKLYSITKYWAEISDASREKFTAVMCNTLASLMRALSADGQATGRADGQGIDSGLESDGDMSEDDVDASSPACRRNGFKQLVYLLSETASQTAKLDTEAASKADKPVRGKTKTGDANANRLHVCLEKQLNSLATAADCEFPRLWPLSVPEEEFVAILPKAAFSVVESASCMKNKVIRAHCVQLASVALARFPVLGTSTTIAVLHMVSSTEHVAAVVADVLGELSTTFRDTQLLKEILRELGRLNVAESKDTSGISNASKFLVRVAESAPRDVLANLAVLLPHLDGPSYTLRSGIVTAMGTIVSKVFPQDVATPAPSTSDDDAKTASLSARDTLLDVLQERVRDVHANTRGAVLKSLASLCLEGALPLDRLHGIAAIAVDRLRDKTSTVRSAAMQLVAALLETSPFGTSLNLNVFLQMQEAEETWLRQRKEHMQLAPAMAAGEEDEEGMTAAGPQEDNEEGKEEEDFAHANARAYIAAAVKFCEQLSAAVPVISQLMGSSTKTEVNEAIRFMSRARSYGLPGLKDGLQRMLTLIWSSEQGIREEVVENFTSMYFTRLSDDGKKSVAQQPQIIAINLVALMSGASLAVITSLEEIMATITKAGTIDGHVIKALWELVALPLQQTPKAHKDVTMHEKQLVIARGAMNLLAMIARADSDSVNTPAGLTRIREVLTSSYDLRLARHACAAVQCLVDCGSASAAKAKLLDEMLALAVQLIRGDWNGRIPTGDAEFYYGAAEQALALVFSISPRPEEVSEHIVKHMVRRLFGGSADASRVNKSELAQLMFVAGHVALKVLVHTETLASKLRRAHHKTPAALQEVTGKASSKTGSKKTTSRGKKAAKDDDEISEEDIQMDFESDEENAAPKSSRAKGKTAKTSAKTATTASTATSGTRTSSRARVATKYSESEWASEDEGAEDEVLEDSEDDDPKPRRGKKSTTAVRKPAAKGKKPATKGKKGQAETPSDDEPVPESTGDKPTSLQAELGLNAAAEEADNELMTDIAENNIVFRNLLAYLAPMIVRIVVVESGLAKKRGAESGNDNRLLESAVLALCKFMCVSSEFCSKHLQLLFKVMAEAKDAGMRATISIALGDLAFRFPNVLEPWTAQLYGGLRDADPRVRKNTLMVLTHLVLNDMVKVKGQLSEIAVCLEDPDPRVKDLTKMFFTELSKRGNNPIYNLLPDVLSCLSRNETVTKPQFRAIMRYLLAFISKDKQSESLVDKLSNRFQTTDDPVQWREIAFCLSQLQLSDRSVRGLVENFRQYKHTLSDSTVCDTFRALASKARKSGLGKGELKEAIVEWEKQIVAASGGTMEEEAEEEADKAVETLASNLQTIAVA